MWNTKIKNESLFYLPIRDPVNWMLTRLQDTTLVLHRSGNGGVAEMCSKLSSDDMVCGAFRVIINDKPTYFDLEFTGPCVSSQKKLKIGPFHRAAGRVFSCGSQGTVIVSGPRQFGVGMEAEILEKIVGIAGLQSAREIKK